MLLSDGFKCRVGQSCTYNIYILYYRVISLLKVSYVHCIYMVLASPIQVLLYAGTVDKERGKGWHLPRQSIQLRVGHNRIVTLYMAV